MPKTRIPIPNKIATDIMFISDRTCCVCRERGKAVQIHHIDENPSNNSIENLSVLCLECHNDTQISGGFGRKLNSDLVIKHRADWIERVRFRREKADEIAIEKMAKVQHTSSEKRRVEIESITYSEERELKIKEYIDTLPKVRDELQKTFQPEWDSGVTLRMVEGCYGYVESLQTILVHLASFYPKGNFGNDNLHEFFSEKISQRYSWHHSIVEPYGPGTGGTIVNILTSHAVMKDVENMIQDMAAALLGMGISVKEFEKWKHAWTGNPFYNYLQNNHYSVLESFKGNDKKSIDENILYLWGAWVNRDGAISWELSAFFSELLIHNPGYILKIFANDEVEFKAWLDGLQYTMFTDYEGTQTETLAALRGRILQSLKKFLSTGPVGGSLIQKIVDKIEKLSIRQID